MERDPRISQSSQAIVKLANEMVEGGVAPLAVANEIALGLGEFLAAHFTPTQAAGMLRDQAHSIGRPDRRQMASDERELLELADNAQQFINTLQIAGIEERDAVTAIVNACTLRVARSRGAAGAADWLRRLADQVEIHAGAITAAARSS